MAGTPSGTHIQNHNCRLYLKHKDWTIVGSKRNQTTIIELTRERPRGVVRAGRINNNMLKYGRIATQAPLDYKQANPQY